MLISMCSDDSSGSTVVTAPPSFAVRNVRWGLPSGPTPLVPSATSTVRVVAMRVLGYSPVRSPLDSRLRIASGSSANASATEISSIE